MKYPNVSASLYDNEFQVNYDCVGVETCRFALCPIMPPTGDDECVMKEYGSCRCIHAQMASLYALHKEIGATLKNLKEQEEC